MLYDGKIVRNEQIGKVMLFLKFIQKVDDLRLDGYVQSGYRLVAYYEFRVESQRSCDADTLSLSAGELVRLTVLMEGLESALVHYLIDVIVELCPGNQIMLSYSLSDDLTYRHTR